MSFSAAVYYIEKEHVVHKVVNGALVEDRSASGNIRSFNDSLWWAFVTSTTVGYGDFYPKSGMGRLAGILLMFFGISFVGIVTGNIASFLVEKQLKEDRGMKALKLKNHFIICGWKRDMDKVLADILLKNRKYHPADIVLINTAPPEDIESIRADRRFTGINFIYGDYIDEKILHRACLKNAEKLLVLADRLVTGSVQEVDSRTVMAIITVKTISKTVYTAAELLDSKFERYLKFSNCDEVILSSDYNRSLIASASTGAGISHVISELLDPECGASISTREIADTYVGKSYSELVSHFGKTGSGVLIGLLENTGNFFLRKKVALEEAQKTPDISLLVTNLKEVKTLTPNQPVLNPDGEYVIKKYSKAIVIEGSSIGGNIR